MSLSLDPRIKAALGKTHYAHAVLEVKEFDTETRVFSGMATTPTPDRVEDVIEPRGAKFANPLSLLLHHDHKLPVGTAKLAKANDAGIAFHASLPDVVETGTLKTRVDEAWHSVKYRVIRGVSIGFRAFEDGIELMKSGGLRFTKIEILELSLVSVPANAEAVISTIKSLDAEYLAATGTGAEASHTQPSAVVDPLKSKARKGATTIMKKTYPEQINDVEATRAAKAARMEEIQNTAMEAGRAKDEQERVEFDELRDAIKGFDAELVDLRDMEKMAVSKATPITPANTATADDASKTRAGHNIIVSEVKLDKGIGFARAVKANLVARLDSRNAVDVAKEMYPSDEKLHKHLSFVQSIPTIVAHLKAAVPGASLLNSLWAGALTDPTNLPGEFIEYLFPATIIGRLNLRSIPTNVRLIEQSTGGTGYWVGVGAPKPLTAFEYEPITLSPTKVAAIAVATEESLRYSSPSLDTLIRDGLKNALVDRVDRDLLDPAEAGTANVQPASLTNGLTALTSAGTSADNIRTDIGKLVRALRTNNLRGPIAIVLPDSLLTSMAWMANALGQPEFPGLDGEGGNFRGVRFIGSEYMANSSGAGNMIVAIAEREVFLSDDGGVRVDASNQASLEMLTNPTNNSVTPTPTTSVSMWQTNSVAFRGEWFINWQKRRSTAVAFIDDANWGSVGSP